MQNQSTPLRGHHLSRISAFSDRDAYEKLMLETGYSTKLGDSFATKVYDFLNNLSKNPAQKVLVTAGTPDFICENCPISTKEKIRLITIHAFARSIISILLVV